MEVRELPLERVVPARNFRLSPPDVEELAESIREHGVLQPIRVRALAGGTYQIIAGHRRHAASKAIGLRTIPAVVVDADDQTTAIQGVVENLQRENLSPLELARGIRQLEAGYRLDSDQIARALSKSPARIRTYLRAARLPDDVLAQLESGEGRTQDVQGLTLRSVERLIRDIPINDVDASTGEGAEKVAEAAGRVRELIQATSESGMRINAHMADAIGAVVRDGRMTVREAVRLVQSDPDRYRYSRAPLTAEELERDTWAAYRRLHQQLAQVQNQLRPEIASGFADMQRQDLLATLDTTLEHLLRYRSALVWAGRPPRDEPDLRSLLAASDVELGN